MLIKCADVMDVGDCARTPTPEIVTKPRTSPTLHTPQRNAKRTPLRERVLNSTVHVAPQQIRLPFDQPSPVDQAIQKPREKWFNAEIEALVEFVLFHSAGDSWPTHKQDGFWSSAGEFLQKRAKTSMCRTGKYIR